MFQIMLSFISAILYVTFDKQFSYYKLYTPEFVLIILNLSIDILIKTLLRNYFFL